MSAPVQQAAPGLDTLFPVNKEGEPLPSSVTAGSDFWCFEQQFKAIKWSFLYFYLFFLFLKAASCSTSVGERLMQQQRDVTGFCLTQRCKAISLHSHITNKFSHLQGLNERKALENNAAYLTLCLLQQPVVVTCVLLESKSWGALQEDFKGLCKAGRCEYPELNCPIMGLRCCYKTSGKVFIPSWWDQQPMVPSCSDTAKIAFAINKHNRQLGFFKGQCIY